MRLVVTVSLLSTAILLTALGYIFMHQPMKVKSEDWTIHWTQGPMVSSSPEFHFHEMSKNERNQCAGTYVDRRKSMMRCTLPDDGSFVRSEQ